MYQYVFKPSADKKLQKLSRTVQAQIIKKLDYYISAPNPLSFARTLTDYDLGQYRYRIGDYRVIFDLEGEKLIILDVDHRKDIYR